MVSTKGVTEFSENFFIMRVFFKWSYHPAPKVHVLYCPLYLHQVTIYQRVEMGIFFLFGLTTAYSSKTLHFLMNVSQRHESYHKDKNVWME